jgi:hypothetical protein
MEIDVVGRSWDLAKVLLNEANIRYNVKVTRPTKDFFKLETEGYYVIRQQSLPDGTLDIRIAARLLKEVF